MSRNRKLVIILGLLLVFAQVCEFLANDNLSNLEKKKEDIYKGYVRYLDILTQALVLRSSYNTLQAVNNSTLFETMVDREAEMMSRLRASLYALTVYVEDIEDKAEWVDMDYYELRALSEELSPKINSQYNYTKAEVNDWKLIVNSVSTIKFILLAVQVIMINFGKND